MGICTRGFGIPLGLKPRTASMKAIQEKLQTGLRHWNRISLQVSDRF